MEESRQIYSHYWIFLRCAGRLSDRELLERFGLVNYQPTEFTRRFGPSVVIGEDGEWTFLADDLLYTLWHKQTTRPTLEQLAKECNVFAGSIGDCDDSHDFIYYRAGELVRKYTVLDHGSRGAAVFEDIGEPLPGEWAAFQHAGVLSRVLAVANSLGIRTEYAESEVRMYIPK